MVLITKNAVCTAKPEPKAWSSGTRSGITYRVTISDGKGTLDLRCKDADVYSVFESFQSYQVAIDVVQAAQDDRIVERATIVGVEPVE